MYQVVYGIFYLLSLLPFRVLFILSDALYLLTYYLIGYRKDVVLNNLLIAFPEKTEEERIRIAKNFYHNFLDTFVETIKLISLSEKQFLKRISVDISLIKKLADTGKNIQLQPCHQFNVEFYNLAYSKALPQLNFVFVYMPFTNAALNKIFQKVRSRFGSKLVSATKFREEKKILQEKQYAITLGADQNPGITETAYKLNFFSKAVLFLPGPAKAAIKDDLAVVFVNFIKVKRGYYRFENTLLTEHAASLTPVEFTKKYRDFTEHVIRQQPANYLWTHKRWKRDLGNSISETQ